MQWRQNHVDIFERDFADDKGRRGVKGRERDTFTGRRPVAVFEAKGVHRFEGFGFPVRDNIAVVFIQAEVPANIHVEVVFVAVITE